MNEDAQNKTDDGVTKDAADIVATDISEQQQRGDIATNLRGAWVAWRGVAWRKEATYDGFDSPNYHPNAMESRDTVWNTHSSLGRYLPFVGLSVSYMLTPVLYLEVLIWLESHPAVCLQRIVHNSNCPPRSMREQGFNPRSSPKVK